jgi:hypothetical protein
MPGRPASLDGQDAIHQKKFDPVRILVGVGEVGSVPKPIHVEHGDVREATLFDPAPALEMKSLGRQ